MRRVTASRQYHDSRNTRAVAPRGGGSLSALDSIREASPQAQQIAVNLGVHVDVYMRGLVERPPRTNRTPKN